MIKNIFFLLIILVISITAISLKSVHFLSPTSDLEANLTGFTVGDSGKIYKTINGGAYWSSQDSHTKKRINSVFILKNTADQIVYAVGDNGTIRKTINGGMNWIIDTINTINVATINLNSVYFLDNNTGIIAGNHANIFRTTNGGTFWDTITVSSVCCNNFNAVYFSDSSLFFNYRGVIVGDNGTVLFSSDKGRSWSVKLSPPLTPDLTSLYIARGAGGLLHDTLFVTGNYGTNGYIFKTGNYGNNWTTNLSIPYPLNSISFKSGGSRLFGIVVGNFGYIYTSRNSGNNWNYSMGSSESKNLYSVCQYDTSIAWATGDMDTVIKTIDGGINWEYFPVNIENISSNIPEAFNLKQNYPNPFNPSTIIEFDITKTSQVRLTFYNSLGKEILEPNEWKLSPGTYRVNENFNNYPSGIYFYKLTTEQYSQTRKMVLLR